MQPTGVVQIQGLLRAQEPRGAFTPANSPEKGQWNFADLEQMSQYNGAQPVLVDAIFRVSFPLLVVYFR